MTDVKEKKQRTPRTYESIKAGALGLPLDERIELAKALKESVNIELKEREEAMAQYHKLYSGIFIL